MDVSQRQPPPRFENPDDTARFRDLLRASDYSGKSVVRALGTDDLSKMRSVGRPLHLARTASGSLLDTLIRLFVLRVPVEPAVLEEVIRPMTLDSWHKAGLVYADGPALHAAVDLLPYYALVLLSDRVLDDGPAPADFVMGLGQTTRSVAAMMVRKPSRLTLDLGTGSGVLALLAAGFSQKVIATDISERALAFARFNAEINGIQNVEFVQGSLFQPVDGRWFDLIVSNPPFVISPGKKFLYRDSGMRGDGLVEAVVRGAAERLADGGFAHIECNWAHLKGQDWKKRLASWAEGTGCDAMVFAQRTRSAAEYAMLWIDETERGTTQQRFDAFGEWIACFRDLGLEAVDNGMFTLRKAGGRANWIHTDTAPEEPGTAAWKHVLQMFQGRDFLGSVPDDNSLLEKCLRPSPDLRVRQDVVYAPGKWTPAKVEIRHAGGLDYGGEIEKDVSEFLMTCDGQRTLREQVAATARATGREEAVLTPICLALARHLVERGFLLPPAEISGPPGAVQGMVQCARQPAREDSSDERS